MCLLERHIGIECPWVYSPWSMPNCNSSIKLIIYTDEATIEKRMLKCYNERCGAMKWLKDVNGMRVSSSSTTSKANNSSE